MRKFRAHRLLTAWIAILAVMLASLAPSVSHALGSSEGASWIEVCSAQGSRWLPSDLDDSRGAPAAAHALEHCPYCSIHVPALGMPPAPEVFSLTLDVKDEFPLAFLAAPHTLHAWLSAQPRAPPLFS